MDLTPEHIRWIIQALIILVLSICVHEYGHALVADKLGDPLPRSQGRVTLNPLAHADPIGTFLFPLMALVLTKGASTGFGWGRPVQTSPQSYSRRVTMRRGHMLVALAGPAMNILLGCFLAVLHVVCLRFGWIALGDHMSMALFYAGSLNFILAFFNLIPTPPLDGGAVLSGLLPTRAAIAFERFAVYGPFVLMAVIFIPQFRVLFMGPAMWVFRNWSALVGAPFYA